MNKLQALLITGLLSLTSVSFASNISTFNFAGYADGNAGTSTAITGLGEAGYTSFSATDNGITVTATGTDSIGNGAAFAYLDGSLGKASAGLGVCSALTESQCDPSNDDNVTNGEAVMLDFGKTLVRLDSLGLVDASHTTLFGGNFQVKVDGVIALTSIMLSANPASVVGLIGYTFEFVNLGGGADYEFYINTISVSAVPIPAAGILFASALFGAGALGRRKKKVKASVVGAFARVS